MSTEQKKPADYTMRDGTPWWKFETMMPPSMDAPILLMNHESGAITPHKDGRYLYDEKDLWTPLPPEAPKHAPARPTAARECGASDAVSADELRLYRMAEISTVQLHLFGHFIEGGSPTPLLDALRKLDSAMKQGGKTP